MLDKSHFILFSRYKSPKFCTRLFCTRVWNNIFMTLLPPWFSREYQLRCFYCSSHVTIPRPLIGSFSPTAALPVATIQPGWLNWIGERWLLSKIKYLEIYFIIFILLQKYFTKHPLFIIHKRKTRNLYYLYTTNNTRYWDTEYIHQNRLSRQKKSGKCFQRKREYGNSSVDPLGYIF